MSKIGYLNQPNAQGELEGELKTLQMQLMLKLIPNAQKLSHAAPDYSIVAQGDIEIGSGWKKVKQKIGDVVIEYITLTIDDPSMSHALNVAAFKKEDGSYEISWRRRQSTQQEKVEAA